MPLCTLHAPFVLLPACLGWDKVQPKLISLSDYFGFALLLRPHRANLSRNEQLEGRPHAILSPASVITALARRSLQPSAGFAGRRMSLSPADGYRLLQAGERPPWSSARGQSTRLTRGLVIPSGLAKLGIRVGQSVRRTFAPSHNGSAKPLPIKSPSPGSLVRASSCPLVDSRSNLTLPLPPRRLVLRLLQGNLSGLHRDA